MCSHSKLPEEDHLDLFFIQRLMAFYIYLKSTMFNPAYWLGVRSLLNGNWLHTEKHNVID